MSQHFEDLIVPIVYRQVTLTQRLVDAYVSSAPKSCPWIGSRPFDRIRPGIPEVTSLYLQMALFTRRVTIDRKLNFNSVYTLLMDLDFLESVK